MVRNFEGFKKSEAVLKWCSLGEHKGSSEMSCLFCCMQFVPIVSPLVHLLILGRFVQFVCYDREYDIDFQGGWSEDQRSGGKASGTATCGIAVFALVVRLQGEIS